MNPKIVQICNICERIACEVHKGSHRAYECQICLTTDPSLSVANYCCAKLVDNSVLPESCFTKEKKKRDVNLEYPTASRTGKRDA